jgi:hypothetical protein
MQPKSDGSLRVRLDRDDDEFISDDFEIEPPTPRDSGLPKIGPGWRMAKPCGPTLGVPVFAPGVRFQGDYV